MSIRDWPAAERPREKLLEWGRGESVGCRAAGDLLAYRGFRQERSGPGAPSVGAIGGLRPLLEASQALFNQQLGLGPAKFAQLQAVLEMAKRHMAERLRHDSVLESPKAVRDYLKAMLRHEPHEIFGCLFLDSRHRVLGFEALSQGTIDAAMVYPRQVVKRALAYNAAALILCHNHPSGSLEPSAADRKLTKLLQKALEVVDVRVLDHIIVGDGDPLSMAEYGWL
ncbi:DNA repair protein RadC [Pseudomonas sp. MAFF 311095]|nr:DNA repair protein RadC [Pseudomonas petroselini]MCD7079112.1 DNA repair protein RadC [Pseudomonas petroselini]